MRELGYYTAYKGKWHLTEKLEKPLPDEKMRILMSGIFLNQNYIKLWKNMVLLTITASAIL